MLFLRFTARASHALTISNWIFYMTVDLLIRKTENKARFIIRFCSTLFLNIGCLNSFNRKRQPPRINQQIIRIIFKGALLTFNKFYSKQCLGYVLPAKHALQSFDQRRLGWVIPRYSKPLMHVHKVQITNLVDEKPFEL